MKTITHKKKMELIEKNYQTWRKIVRLSKFDQALQSEKGERFLAVLQLRKVMK